MIRVRVLHGQDLDVEFGRVYSGAQALRDRETESLQGQKPETLLQPLEIIAAVDEGAYGHIPAYTRERFQVNNAIRLHG
jgi:hypothetical protein